MTSRPASQYLPPWLRALLIRVPFVVRIYRAFRRGEHARERNVLLLLVGASLLIGLLAARFSSVWASPSTLILVVLIGGLQLRLRSLGILLAVVAGALAAIATRYELEPGLLITVAFTAALAVLLSRTRGELGVQGLRGDAMLLELRDRLKAQSDLPKLPKGWGQKVVLKQAGGSSFGGDFVVSVRTGSRLEIALVDVSGKGVGAGTRALLLSGTFGGLLGSVPGEDFLPACNAYLHRQREREGFVTAIHLTVDLKTGRYVITSAGHPPAVKLDAGSGTWQVSTAKGVVLGVVPDLHCEADTGVLRKGDALMFYTDGLIEEPGRDIDAGIDKLLGEAETQLRGGFRQGAEGLVKSMAATHNDDCALVLLWRP